MTFQKLTPQDILRLLPYFRAQKSRLSNYTAGYLYLWERFMNTHFAEEDGCLLLRDRYVNNYYFYYPLSCAGDEIAEERALEKIEAYCRANNVRLHFTAIPREKLPLLALRYGADLHISNIRRWRDYIYAAEDFRTYSGGRYSGQRNHVNKFKKNNPDYSFSLCTEADIPELRAFLREYSAVQYAKDDPLAGKEMNGVFSMLPHVFAYGMRCGALRAGGKMVAMSVGEVCGDTLFVHVEKALRGVEGAYPAVAQMFACACAEGVAYINREDDGGDAGLRKSKMQYLPVRLADKYNLAVHRSIDALTKLPELHTERLTLKEVEEKDAAAFASLARDIEENKYWGYDWRQDAPADPDDMWFLEELRSDFKKKNELPLGIYLRETLVGEVVLHAFGCRAEAEIGMRLLPAYRHNGYAREALLGLMEYGFIKLGLERIEAKCFRANEPSARTLRAAGMRPCGEDETYFYFYKTAAM